jgi:hypothetical protein
MGQCKGVREVGYFDCDGGGQIVVDGNYAYIGHVNGTTGTTIVDVGDPKNPRQVANIPTAPGIHAHKVRAANGLMLVNREHPPRRKGPALTAEELSQPVGLGIYDISDPRRPKEITMWRCTGNGVHRFTFDGRYAYISPEMEGYIGNIVMILDLEDPGRPEEVGRWWMPGQWIAGGETPGWKGRAHRCHHPIRLGDRLYTSYWHGGAVILDISDMRRPKCVGAIDWSPPFPWPTHSCVPVPFPLAGRRWMLVADEDVLPLDPELTGDGGVHVDGRHHRRGAADASGKLSGRRRQRQGQPGDDRLPSADRGHPGHRSPLCVVRPGLAFPRHRQSELSARSCELCAGRARGRGSRLQQRRVPRPARPRLCDRPRARPSHRRAHGQLITAPT